jgi:hypothetical protein
MSEFDAKRLEQRLRGLIEKQLALFALSCAERLYPAYAQQRELHDGAALNAMWNALTMDDGEGANRYSDLAEGYLRGEDAEWNPANPILDNSIAVALYAEQCLSSGRPLVAGRSRQDN